MNIVLLPISKTMRLQVTNRLDKRVGTVLKLFCSFCNKRCQQSSKKVDQIAHVSSVLKMLVQYYVAEQNLKCRVHKASVPQIKTNEQVLVGLAVAVVQFGVFLVPVAAVAARRFLSMVSFRTLARLDVHKNSPIEDEEDQPTTSDTNRN